VYTLYLASERLNTAGAWGTSVETFFASEQEKYLRFGNLVQVTTTTLNSEGGNSGMKLHRNMELVDIMVRGSVGFQDSFGVTSMLPESTVQVVSAGKGIYQMEFNAGTQEAEKLQIGFLPSSLNREPVKTKALFDLYQNNNTLVELVSPNNIASLTVRQHAAVLLGEFDAGRNLGYTLNSNMVGLFIYVLNGVVSVHTQILRRGDSVGIANEEQVMIQTAEQSRLLVIEVAMGD
jgi:redox-sensitive bicupin YhaK (pirin superfamily)